MKMRLKYVSHDMDPLTVCVSQVGVVFWSVGQCSSSHDVLIQRISRMPDPPYMYMSSVLHVTSTTCHPYHMSHVITVSSQPSLHVHVISTTCHMSPQCPPNPPYMYMSSVPHVISTTVSSQPSLHVHVISTTCHMSLACHVVSQVRDEPEDGERFYNPVILVQFLIVIIYFYFTSVCGYCDPLPLGGGGGEGKGQATLASMTYVTPE